MKVLVKRKSLFLKPSRSTEAPSRRYHSVPKGYLPASTARDLAQPTQRHATQKSAISDKLYWGGECSTSASTTALFQYGCQYYSSVPGPTLE
eukprot:2929788-Rhodomonas_salina.1